MKNFHWKTVKGQSLPNLLVLETTDGKELGFIYKPKDSRTDKNAWRIHKGIGECNVFVGHDYDKNSSKSKLEIVCGVQRA